MKEIKAYNSEKCWDWNQSVWWSLKVGWDGLDKLNVKISTNCMTWEVEGIKRGDARRRRRICIKDNMESL